MADHYLVIGKKIEIVFRLRINFQVRQLIFTTNIVYQLISWLVSQSVTFFNNLHVAPYWLTWPSFHYRFKNSSKLGHD